MRFIEGKEWTLPPFCPNLFGDKCKNPNKTEPIEVTDFPVGENEVTFSLYGVRFHLLDENPQLGMIAPEPDDPKPIWFNIMVPDIAATYSRAINEGCMEVQPITELADYGVSNAMFHDSFGYIWMLHQVHRDVSADNHSPVLFPEHKQSRATIGQLANPPPVLHSCLAKRPHDPCFFTAIWCIFRLA